MTATEYDYHKGLIHRLESIYQDIDKATLSALADRVMKRLACSSKSSAQSQPCWDESSCLLISYADSITDGRK